MKSFERLKDSKCINSVSFIDFKQTVVQVSKMDEILRMNLAH